MIGPQLPLGVELPQTATFDAFVGNGNAEIRAALVAVVTAQGARQFYLHGPPATGKTHLLQAASRAAAAAGQRSAYVPLAEVGDQGAGLLAGMQTLACVCVDDVSMIAGQRAMELAMIGLIDGLRANGGQLLIADRYPPAELTFALPDLASRLGWGSVFALVEPDDADKQQLLMRRAAQRGMQLPAATAQYLLRHGSRDVPSLMALLARLDTASLAAQRRLTIPFVKQVLARQVHEKG
ncbi:MAG TPA: DnaA regulatory inactivator Hda [Salinisphaeraceae bacterium]|nr:DnaA regulatory inactivator Hda [Salinisphaeraceae bacterium]